MALGDLAMDVGGDTNGVSVASRGMDMRMERVEWGANGEGEKRGGANGSRDAGMGPDERQMQRHSSSVAGILGPNEDWGTFAFARRISVLARRVARSATTTTTTTTMNVDAIARHPSSSRRGDQGAGYGYGHGPGVQGDDGDEKTRMLPERPPMTPLAMAGEPSHLPSHLRTPSLATSVLSSVPSTTTPILRSALRTQTHTEPPVSVTATGEPRRKHRPNTSQDLSKNWLTTTAAPRFSRAGLGEPGVVMPVRAPDRPMSVVEVEGWGEAVLIHRYGEREVDEEQGEEEEEEDSKVEGKTRGSLRKLGRALSLGSPSGAGRGWRRLFRRHVQ
ncbi:hypothetical protein M422DRAFT_774327 [Sphaerobolus stellatus SS14]|nr:hypothetical protein M422DRAFT_774327 [Sphaerobolus stellatus SS14]